MGVLGDLLEAVHDAPRAQSLHLRATQGQDHEKLREAFERANRAGGGHSVQMAVAVGSGPSIPTGVQESQVELWYSPDAWRLDNDVNRVIAAHGKVLRIHPGMGGVVSNLAELQMPFDGLAMYLAPVQWLGAMRFRIVAEETHVQRPCWRVTIQPIDTRRRMPMHLPMFGAGALDYELWIDQVTGIVVRAEGRMDGELASTFVVDEIEVDLPIPPDVFDLVTPDGSPIRSQGEMQLEHLRARGVDVSGIDPEDPAAVQEAMRVNMMALHQPPDVESLAAQYTPTGPPPDDEEDALIDVGAVFQAMGALNDDGTELVNVEGGQNLGPCAAEVRRRFPQQTATSELEIDKVKFLDTTEAVVWFRSTYFGTREGRAVHREGRWKVSRATYCGLVAMAGVRCPPPPEPST